MSENHWAVEFVEVHQRPLLTGLSFAVPAVGVTAVVDASGSIGQALFRMVAGLERVDDGAVIVFGQDMSRAASGDRKRLQRRLGVVFGGPEFALFADGTARENVTAFVDAAGRAGRRRERGIVDRALRSLDLEGVADALPGDLTPAERKRLAVARALAVQPPLFLADAFDRDSDDDEVEALARVVREDRYVRGSAALLFMHDADLATRLADEVFDISPGVALEA